MDIVLKMWRHLIADDNINRIIENGETSTTGSCGS